MARELQVIYHYTAGTTLYGCLFHRDTGLVWNPSTGTFETWGTAGRSADDYDLAVTHRGASLWSADFPGGPDDGLYRFVTYLQSGASPANGDSPISDNVGRRHDGQWSGPVALAIGSLT